MRVPLRRVIAVGGLTLAMGVAMSLPVAAHGNGDGGGRAALRGNTAKALLSLSTQTGPAPAGAQVDLLLGLNYRSHPANGYPVLPTFITDSVTPGSPYFHEFLTPAEFQAAYDPKATAVAALTSYLKGYGITVTADPGNRIEAVGTVGEVEQAFDVSINKYVPSYLVHGKSYFANLQNPTLPTAYAYGTGTYDLAQEVSGISGMTTYDGIHAMSINQSQLGLAQGSNCQTFCSAPIGYSPQAIADHYQASPLYDQQINGAGVTIAVATLAPLRDSDAVHFWRYYGISRPDDGTGGTYGLTQVSVDGAPTNEAIPGSGGSESSLDVERSGAMAPGADIIAYIGQNTNNGFVNLFDTVVEQDMAQVMTTSWGEAELDETAGYATLLNQAFAQGAAEGISMFAASGDSGAYDAYPQYKSLTVDSPGSSTYITAAGGTTLPNPKHGVLIAPATTSKSGSTPAVYYPVTTEFAWGWSYLLNPEYYKALGLNNLEQAQRSFYPVGSGGGYSMYFSVPSWQKSFQASSERGVPDVALNADPFTGYAIYDTGSTYSDAANPWSNGWGGTSFAAPQWAGITALLDQAAQSSQGLGLVSDVFYSLPKSGGSVAGFTAITSGNNWGYQAASNSVWSPTTGLGVPDVVSLATAIEQYNGVG